MSGVVVMLRNDVTGFKAQGDPFSCKLLPFAMYVGDWNNILAGKTQDVFSVSQNPGSNGTEPGDFIAKVTATQPDVASESLERRHAEALVHADDGYCRGAAVQRRQIRIGDVREAFHACL